MDWESFFARYRPLALRIARGLVGEDQAEELVQEASRALVERSRRQPPLDGVAHARNHFLLSLRHLAASEHRRRGVRGESEELEDPIDPAPGPIAGLEDAEDEAVRRGQVRDAMDRLSADEREALTLRYTQGLTFDAMSKHTGRAISTLQSRVEAALSKIRDHLGSPGGRT